jgi:hypothetical protein
MTQSSLPSGSAMITQPTSGRRSLTMVAPSRISLAISSSCVRSLGMMSRCTRFLDYLSLGNLDEVEPRPAVAHGGIRVSRLGLLDHWQPGNLPPESG